MSNRMSTVRTAIAMAIVEVVPAVAVPGVAGAVPAGSITFTTVSQSSVGVSQVNQLAGDLRLTIPATPAQSFTPGEQVRIAVDDADPQPNCQGGADDVLAFNTVPVVAVVGTASLSASLTSSGGPCPTVTDVLVLTVSTAGTATRIDIGNIRYNLGPSVSSGDVRVTGTHETPQDLGTVSNAFATRAFLTANNPPAGLQQGPGFQPVSPLVIAEQLPTALDGRAVCVVISNGTFDISPPAPTIAVTGTDTATTPVVTAGFVRIAFTAGTTPSASTFTVNGLRTSTTDRGLQTVVAAEDTSGALANCSSTATPALSVATTIAYVGNVGRFGGSDRFGTAQMIFEDQFACTPAIGSTAAIDTPVAILARSDLFPDALAASHLAGRHSAGILLTETDSLPPSTLDVLRRHGVNRVFIAGGPDAISGAVEDQLRATLNYRCGGAVTETDAQGSQLTLDVARVGGADRYETARAIALYPSPGAGGTADYDGAPSDPDGPSCDQRTTAIVATGENFPDALAAGSVAFRGNLNGCGGGSLPLLLTPSAELSEPARTALQQMVVQQVLLMGGTAAVSTTVEEQIEAMGISVTRVAGANRQDTASLFATFANQFLRFEPAGGSADDVSLARGDLFPDSLTGGPHAGKQGQVILLTLSPGSLGAETSTFLTGHRRTLGELITRVEVYGGVDAIADGVVGAALAALSQA
jgi:putative cell wall-binding protein